MSDIVIDVLLIKHIEKVIERPLTPDELEEARSGEYLIVALPNKKLDSYQVDRYRFPHDVMTELLHLTQTDFQRNTNFFSAVEDWKAFNEVEDYAS